MGAAVNCENKNDFIAGLMTLDEMVQAELMNFIQVILDSCVPVGQTPENLSEDDLKQRLYELEKVKSQFQLSMNFIFMRKEIKNFILSIFLFF